MRPHAPLKAAVVSTLNEREGGQLRELLENRSGLRFSSNDELFQNKVCEHMQARRIAQGSDLLRLVRSSRSEYESLLEKLTNAETTFFANKALFDALQHRVLPDMHVKKFWENPRTLRLWCVGCGSGESAYSAAITLCEAVDFTESWNVQLLATDVSRRAIEHADRGVYSSRAMGEMSTKLVETNFARVGDQFLVKSQIRNLVSFAPMSLIDGPYMGRFDAILCMDSFGNLPAEKHPAAVNRLYESLEPGGFLFFDRPEVITRTLNFHIVNHKGLSLMQKPITGSAPRWMLSDVSPIVSLN